ncbi:MULTISPECIES: hypothetical protein [unclassified Nitratiruptor]|uniref:hypothetical protein n=1 Tax=unclassified Nitratiruptor TaxID=2624044 RepID=UPI001914EA2B|nr:MULTISPECIES: hypothetical protein [unclassified Nitratiruptor]BCD60072.1 hypothetical protein NitYY0810_C0837 [Nitratiruptor sp. YY08-10]BCD64439.1 hypothetical protein NitYY0814_C1284 [Nitratiruptor sp. YY08-14]
MNVSVAGKAKIVKIYNISRLEMEGIEWDAFDLESAEDVKELFEIAKEYVESAEADAIEAPEEIHCADPDESSIEIDSKTYYTDDVILKNKNIVDLLPLIQNAKVGDIFFVVVQEGDGRWDLVADIEHAESNEVEFGYVDCSVLFDQYDILREGYLDVLCDTLLPETLKVKDAAVELQDFVFHPVQSYGQLYVVKKDPVGDVKVLQKIDYGGRMLSGTDMIVDDFEAN